LAVPQAPLTGIAPVEQEAVVPPFEPVQVQVQGPEPLISVALPESHKLAAGVEDRLAPLDDPQTPSVERLVEQEAVVPPFCPEQDQDQGPSPEIEEAVPVLQKLEVGAV